MKIYGLRIYPQTTTIDTDGDIPIYFHEAIDEELGDFEYIFSPIKEIFLGRIVSDDFCRTIGEDPVPDLKKEWGEKLVDIYLEPQLITIDGNKFDQWKKEFNPVEGALYGVFNEKPTTSELNLLHWSKPHDISTRSWPGKLRCLIHMWDDIYWEFYTSNESDIEKLVEAHRKDPLLKMYYVDFENEYPDPSNGKLQEVV